MTGNLSQLETPRWWFGDSIFNAMGRRTRRATETVLVALIVIALSLPVSHAQSELIAKEGAKLIDSIKTALSIGPPNRSTQPLAGRNESPSERASLTAHLRLCPKKLSLHVEESYTLVPLPMDLDRRTIHGAETTWSSSDPSVASVASFGEVEARSPGRAVITVQVGDKRANVLVEVEAGVRQRLTEAEWDERHSNDCDDPEALATDSKPPGEGERRKAETSWAHAEQSAPTDVSGPAAQLKARTERAVPSAARLAARPAAMRTLRRVSTKGPVTAPASAMPPRAKPFLPFQGGGAFEFFPEATFVENAVGSPRFSPVEATNGATKTKNNLGSSNYGFTAGLLGLGGRGIGVNLALVYNGTTLEQGHQWSYNDEVQL